MSDREAKEKIEASARVIGAARRVLEPRPSTFEGMDGTFEGTNATRCVCGCDPQVEEMRRALSHFDAVFHKWDERARGRPGGRGARGA